MPPVVDRPIQTPFAQRLPLTAPACWRPSLHQSSRLQPACTRQLPARTAVDQTPDVTTPAAPRPCLGEGHRLQLQSKYCTSIHHLGRCMLSAFGTTQPAKPCGAVRSDASAHQGGFMARPRQWRHPAVAYRTGAPTHPQLDDARQRATQCNHRATTPEPYVQPGCVSRQSNGAVRRISPSAPRTERCSARPATSPGDGQTRPGCPGNSHPRVRHPFGRIPCLPSPGQIGGL